MKKYYLLFLFLILITGCTFTPSINNYEIDLSNLPEVITLNNFEISDIKLIVKDHNNIEKTVTLDESMISNEDFDKLKQPGIHNITVNYQNIKKSFEIEIQPNKYKVTFLDFNKDIISEQYVIEGEDALLPNYDKIIGYNLTGFSSEEYLNVTKDCIITPIYEENILIVKFMVNNELVEERQIQEGQQLLNLPKVPEIVDYIGFWDVEEGVVIMDNMTINATYKIDDTEEQLQKTQEYINKTYSNITVDSNIILETSYIDTTITWETNSLYLSNSGKLKRPYEKTNIEITYSIEYNNQTLKGSIPLTLEGYKDITKNVASGYIYRNYYGLTNQFFETMDIIYCAFIMFNPDGTLKNNAGVLANIEYSVLPKAKENGIYTVLSLGGGGSEPSSAFASVTKNAEARKTLINNIIDIINKYGFDGVDVDWETPTSSQAQYFTLFIKELNEAVKKNNSHHLITAAIGGGKWQPTRYDLSNSSKYLDFINVMTYSMSSSSGYYQNALYKRTGFHNTEYRVGGTLSSCSIDETVTIYNNLGVQNNKLIFGLAFYGTRQYNNEGRWVSNGSIYYTTIKNQYLNNPNYTYYYDEDAQVPYIISNDLTTFISFDDPRSIAAKCDYVKNNNCAGLMYWENGCDTTGDLVQAIYDNLKQ